MKKLYTIICFLSSLTIFAQSNFEWQRIWGTYFGPIGAQIAIGDGSYYPGLLFDSQENIYIEGEIDSYSQYNQDYYNQFVLGDGQNSIPGDKHFEAEFTDSGSLVQYGYLSPLSSGQKRLYHIDNQNNKYYIYRFSSTPPIAPTANVWFSEDPVGNIYKNILAKYSADGVLQWATYLPSSDTSSQINSDDAGNIFVTGRTTLQQGITTPGVFQEDYQVLHYSNGGLIPSGYVAKLSPDGQRIWASYYPSIIINIKCYDGNLYMSTTADDDINGTSLATSGAFQTTKSDFAICKMNADTGERIWGTYYGGTLFGNGPAADSYIIAGLAINERGLYIMGQDDNLNGANYFGTSGSYKPQAEGYDIFLSKFDLDGSRQWSTYFGSTADEMAGFNGNTVVISGDDIYLAGVTYGVGNNIATPGSYKDSPDSNNFDSANLWFCKFNSSGNLVWSSYYGETGTNSYGFINYINIAVKNNALYLYGDTNSLTGFVTDGAWQSQPVNPINGYATAFMAKFELNPLSTAESSQVDDIVLYSNPNNGSFTLDGSVFQKENCSFAIHDLSGKLIDQQTMKREKTQTFNLQNKLVSGSYFIQINNSKNQNLKVFKMLVR